MADILSRLAVHALLPLEQLAWLARSSPHRYKVYQIPKRAPGQYRTIAQPAKEVKLLQYWVMKHVLSKFEIHPAATAYRAGRSILQNAKPHTRSRFLLKLDFENFFPSIKARDLRSFLRRKQERFDKVEVELLCQILFWNPKGTRELCLAIGAPSSPLLSNILMIDFDRKVNDACAKRRIAYTRYADDLTFSATHSDDLQYIEAEVARLCRRMRSPLLTLNGAKTVRVSKRDARRVTGLIITNDRKVSLGRDEKRRVRASVHHFATDRLSLDDVAKLRGTLAYVNSVEPEFLKRLEVKYGKDTIQRCIRGASGR